MIFLKGIEQDHVQLVSERDIFGFDLAHGEKPISYKAHEKNDQRPAASPPIIFRSSCKGKLARIDADEVLRNDS